ETIERPGARARAGDTRVAEAVIGLPLGGVAQYLVGLVDLLEVGLRALVFVHIGMELARQAAKGLLDFIFAGVALQAQHFVIVAFGGHRLPLHQVGRATRNPLSSIAIPALWVHARHRNAARMHAPARRQFTRCMVLRAENIRPQAPLTIP